jgi:hypothetical protein
MLSYRPATPEGLVQCGVEAASNGVSLDEAVDQSLDFAQHPAFSREQQLEFFSEFLRGFASVGRVPRRHPTHQGIQRWKPSLGVLLREAHPSKPQEGRRFLHAINHVFWGGD